MKQAHGFPGLYIFLLLFVLICNCKNQANKFYDLGLYFEKKGQYGQAVVEYQKALDKDPKNVDAQYHLGIAYRGSDMLDDAEKAFHKTVELRPRHVGALSALAEIAYTRHDNNTAKELTTRVLSISPRSVDGLSLMAGLLLDEKKYSEAEDYFRRALSLDPRNAELHYALAYAYFNDADSDRAGEAVSELRLAEKNGKDIGKALEYFRRELQRKGRKLEDYEGAGQNQAAQGEGRQAVGQ